MAKLDRIILWDFEGTLVDRPGRWRSAVMEVLDINEPGHQVDMEEIRPLLRGVYPWHHPDEIHTHLDEPAKWWAQLEQRFARVYQDVGFPSSRAEELSSYIRTVFTNPFRFDVYEDTFPTLTALLEKGWRHAILSNHVPELQNIITKLGLARYFEYCFTSGITGYEKPNPKAFQYALEVTGQPGRVWMIGDNNYADIRGAESVGIPAILVRDIEGCIAKYNAQNLDEVVSIIETGQ